MNSDFVAQKNNWMGEVFRGNLHFNEAADLMEHRVQLVRCSGGIDKCVIMVGGLPGSGKTSFVADLLNCGLQLGDRNSTSCLSWEMESLDEADFFIKNGIPFHVRRLEEAQNWTYERFESLFETTWADIIIVQCIHLTRDQYDRYAASAKAHGAISLWAQFVCDSPEQAENLRARSELAVPDQVVARWYNNEYAPMPFGNPEQGLIPIAPNLSAP
jgi:hypothetical protein